MPPASGPVVRPPIPVTTGVGSPGRLGDVLPVPGRQRRPPASVGRQSPGPTRTVTGRRPGGPVEQTRGRDRDRRRTRGPVVAGGAESRRAPCVRVPGGAPGKSRGPLAVPGRPPGRQVGRAVVSTGRQGRPHCVGPRHVDEEGGVARPGDVPGPEPSERTRSTLPGGRDEDRDGARSTEGSLTTTVTDGGGRVQKRTEPLAVIAGLKRVP